MGKGKQARENEPLLKALFCCCCTFSKPKKYIPPPSVSLRPQFSIKMNVCEPTSKKAQPRHIIPPVKRKGRESLIGDHTLIKGITWKMLKYKLQDRSQMIMSDETVVGGSSWRELKESACLNAEGVYQSQLWFVSPFHESLILFNIEKSFG